MMPIIIFLLLGSVIGVLRFSAPIMQIHAASILDFCSVLVVGLCWFETSQSLMHAIKLIFFCVILFITSATISYTIGHISLKDDFKI